MNIPHLILYNFLNNDSDMKIDIKEKCEQEIEILFEKYPQYLIYLDKEQLLQILEKKKDKLLEKNEFHSLFPYLTKNKYFITNPDKTEIKKNCKNELKNLSQNYPNSLLHIKPKYLVSLVDTDFLKLIFFHYQLLDENRIKLIEIIDKENPSLIQYIIHNNIKDIDYEKFSPFFLHWLDQKYGFIKDISFLLKPIESWKQYFDIVDESKRHNINQLFPFIGEKRGITYHQTMLEYFITKYLNTGNKEILEKILYMLNKVNIDFHINRIREFKSMFISNIMFERYVELSIHLLAANPALIWKILQTLDKLEENDRIIRQKEKEKKRIEKWEEQIFFIDKNPMLELCRSHKNKILINLIHILKNISSNIKDFYIIHIMKEYLF